MPWKEMLPMEQRASFVLEVQKQEESFARLCRVFGVSRRVGYKWWKRFCQSGLSGLEKRRSRPHRSPRASERKWRERVIELRQRYPWWGATKFGRWILRVGFGPRMGSAAIP